MYYYHIEPLCAAERIKAMALLEYRDLTKIYARMYSPAVNGINLDISSGRIVGLLGPNGSGKTTLLKMTAGILSSTGGSIKIDGLDVGAETKALVSYLPERTYLDETLTVKETLKYFKDFYKDFKVERAEEMLNSLDVDIKARIKTLSKGTREKIQLVLVMCRDARLYLLDEPIAGVDPAARERILNTVISNYSRNSTVIISTHLIADIEPLLDDVLFLSYGNIALASNAETLRQEKGKSVDELFREMFRC